MRLDVHAMLSKSSPDVVVIIETFWVTILDYEILLENHVVFMHDWNRHGR